MQIGAVGRHKAFKSTAECVRYTVRHEGLRGLTRGVGATIAREVPGNAVFFSIYEGARQLFPAPAKSENPAQDSLMQVVGQASSAILCGGLAGCAMWASVLPLDVPRPASRPPPPAPPRMSASWGTCASSMPKVGLAEHDVAANVVPVVEGARPVLPTLDCVETARWQARCWRSKGPVCGADTHTGEGLSGQRMPVAHLGALHAGGAAEGNPFLSRRVAFPDQRRETPFPFSEE
eukprot:jgi/Botrbrau1/15441/Bobra.43_2s0066.1